MFQWDDLRYFLATTREGNTSAAARLLGVNQSTVSRRLAALEQDLDLKLFSRTPSGLVLSADGKRLEVMAKRIEEQVHDIERELSASKERVEGVVRITTIEEMASVVIVPNLKMFRARWPHIQLELLTGMRNFDLSRNQADVALRLARPQENDLIARKVGGFGYGVYASKAYLEGLDDETLSHPERMDWLVLDAGAHEQQSREWLTRNFPNLNPIMRISSFKPMVNSVQAGLGVALLPRPYGHFYDDLVPLPIDTRDLRRDIWLVVHKDMRRVPAVVAVLEFLEEVMRTPIDLKNKN